jgi:hypothetical protein
MRPYNQSEAHIARRARWNASVTRTLTEWRDMPVAPVDRTTIEHEVREILRVAIRARLNILCAGVFVAAERMEERLRVLAQS